MTKKVDFARWKIAQESEKEYWSDFTKDSLIKEDKEVYPQKVKYLISKWTKIKKLKDSFKILQIGCGPDDVINYLNFGDKYSIDPLADFYKKHFKLDYKAKFIQGSGESLPYQDKFFDIVILTNVLDHTNNPQKVLSEAKRVLKDDGIFHFEVFTYQNTFLFLAKIWAIIKKTFTKEIYNIHHPFMFNKKQAKELVLKDFIILSEDIGKCVLDKIDNMKDLIKKRKEDKRLTTRILAYLGLYGFINYTAICKKG